MHAPHDERWMARALELARHGLYWTDPNPRVGCVLLRDGSVVGEGWTDPTGGPHAEVNALRDAGEAARGATAYVSLEPCAHHGRTPPCTEALIRAGVRRVVCAVEDPNPLVNGAGIATLRAAGVLVESGVGADEAAALNPGFMKRMRDGLPWVTLKIASTLDGRVALRNGESRWITGQEARRDVHRLRARCSAVLTGVGSVLADDPRLTVRDTDADLRGRIPLRVICDPRLRVPARARLFTEAGPVRIYAAAPADAGRIAVLAAAGAQVIPLEGDGEGRPRLRAVLEDLARGGCNELLVEAGPTLSGAFLASGLVDLLVLYLNPSLLGDDARSLAVLPPVARLDERLRLQLLEARPMGDDLKLLLAPFQVDADDATRRLRAARYW